MKNIEIKILIQSFTNIDQLSAEDNMLINKAKDAANKAYAPYSGFSVGAALLLSNNEIITGSNQENAAYPSGLCAERVALFYANAQYPESSVNTIVVCAKNKNGFMKDPIPPCGSCRQVIIETAERYQNKIKLIMYADNEIQIIEDATQLLPLYFKKSSLG